MAHHRLLVVSDRWDSLGGRLVSLVNARAVASALGADFGFVWPRRGETIDYPASALFSAAFCERHEIHPAALDDHVRVAGRELFSLTLAEATSRAATFEPNTAVFISQPFAPERFSGETPEEATRRFRVACDSLEFSDEAAAIRSMIGRDVGTPPTALHARFGDIVAGAWSQWVPREKFRPLVFFELAARRHSSDEPIVAVSDTPEIVERLRERVSAVRGVGDLCPGYRTLTGPARDWADLFTLWSSQLILSPSISAFSRFAALASGGQLFDVLGAVPPDQRVATMLATAQSGGAATEFDASLRARELCYLLDSDSGELSVTTRHRLAVDARRSDPAYVGAHSREAAALAAAGHPRAAVRAARRAVHLAAPNRVHDDPGLDAETSLVMTGIVASVCTGSWRRRQVLQTVRAAAAAATKRHPWQMHQAEIRFAIEYLTRLVEATVATGSRSQARRWRRRGRTTREMLAPRGCADRTSIDVWRDNYFDPVLATLERTAMWLMNLLADDPLSRGNATKGRASAIRELAPTSNGVRWIEVTCDQQVTSQVVVVEHPSLPTPSIGVRAWNVAGGDQPRFVMPLVNGGTLAIDASNPDEWTITAIG